MENWRKKKDIGWSWLVLCASFFTQMIALGTILSFGIYFVILRDYFNCTRQQVAAIGAIAYGTLCLTGPVAGLLSRKFGCCVIVMAGGMLSCLGLLISSFASDRWHLYISYGLLTGTGLGLAYTPSIGVLPDYFDKYRFFATAFVSIGAAVGTLIMSPFLLFLIDHYHWRGSMLISAGLALQLVLCGSIMKSKSTQPNLKFTVLLEISLLKNRKFQLLCVHGFLIGGICFVVFSMANSIAMARGITLASSALLVSMMSACNGIGRCTASLIGHCPCTNRLLFFTLATTCVGVSALLVTLCHDFLSFAFALGCFGLHFGMVFSQMPVVAIDLFGPSKLINAVGYYICAVGAGGISIPPAAGWLVDQTVSNDSAFILAGLTGLLASVAGVIVYIIRFREKRHEGTELAIVLDTDGDTIKK